MEFKITKEQQLKELNDRIPPILNVDIVVVKDGKYLIGRRSLNAPDHTPGLWLFPGGRMRWTETLQEASYRILNVELPGVEAQFKKLITAVSHKGSDRRAYGVTLYYLFEYKSGEPQANDQLDTFKWVDRKELLAMEKAFEVNKSIVEEIDATIKSMNSTQDELLVEVDSNNKEIGSIVKRDAHVSPDHFHRAAHIMLFNSQGEVVLQQRSQTKATSPGKWDMPGGHQALGQTIDQTADAELSEEMGVHTKLTLVDVILSKKPEQSEWCYLYWGVHDGPYGFDKNEVAQVKAFDCEKLLAHEYEDYEILDHVFGYTEKLREVWEPLTKK